MSPTTGLGSLARTLFTPAPNSPPKGWNLGDGLLSAVDAGSALAWVVLIAQALRTLGLVDLSDDDARTIYHAVMIAWPLIVGAVAWLVRWAHPGAGHATGRIPR